jgi:hypothetical protein
MSPVQWQELLSHPALGHLTLLSYTIWKGDDSVPQLTAKHLPALNSFHVGTSFAHYPAGYFEALAQMKELTELNVTDLAAPREPGRSTPENGIAAVGQCKKLRSLSMNAVANEEIHAVLNSPADRCCNLRTLAIFYLDAKGDDGGVSCDWPTIFSRLTQLESLILRRIFYIDVLLAGLNGHCPALRSLSLPALILDDIPSLDVLTSSLEHLQICLESRPLLILSIHLPQCPLHQSTPRKRNQMDAWRAMHFPTLVEKFPGRVEVTVFNEGR